MSQNERVSVPICLLCCTTLTRTSFETKSVYAEPLCCTASNTFSTWTSASSCERQWIPTFQENLTPPSNNHLKLLFLIVGNVQRPAWHLVLKYYFRQSVQLCATGSRPSLHGPCRYDDMHAPRRFRDHRAGLHSQPCFHVQMAWQLPAMSRWTCGNSSTEMHTSLSRSENETMLWMVESNKNVSGRSCR